MEKVKSATKHRDCLQREMDNVCRLMVRCKAGMTHICQKLKDISIPSGMGASSSVTTASPSPTPTEEAAEGGAGVEGAEAAEPEITVAPETTAPLDTEATALAAVPSTEPEREAPMVEKPPPKPPGIPVEIPKKEAPSMPAKPDPTLALIKVCREKVNMLTNALSKYDYGEEMDKIMILEVSDAFFERVDCIRRRIWAIGAAGAVNSPIQMVIAFQVETRTSLVRKVLCIVLLVFQ